jgi:cytochrome c peroxidase
MARAFQASMAAALLSASGCATPPEPSAEDVFVERGREIFFTETFGGNGRTCATCHREEDNFGLSPAFIATPPDDDPLFVAEFSPDLGRGFESPRLLRSRALIVENLDGFEDLDRVFVMRGVPHLLALSTSVASRDGPRVGWSGDGAPGDGSLRAFSTGAVIQHFTKTTARIPGVDFRLPTPEELDALEAFMLSLGRQADLDLPLPLADGPAARGQDLFLSASTGKCAFCHVNAGANADPSVFGEGAGNMNFNTGVEEAPGKPQDGTDDLVPPDDGFGFPGDGTFNTPPLVEAADTGPFFHDNSVDTIEAAVAFYRTRAFNNSPAGASLRATTGSRLDLDDEQVAEIAAFLRVLNALENIRQARAYLRDAAGFDALGRAERGLRLAPEEVADAVGVLDEAGLHPDAVGRLRDSLELIERAQRRRSGRARLLEDAIDELDDAARAMRGEG